MKTIKYIIYLLLLLIIGGAILISTDKGEYTKTETTTLHAPQEMVYDALRKWNNWKLWHIRWTEDPTTSLHTEAAVLEWASNNKLYENGRAEFSKSIPYTTIEYDAEIETSSGVMKEHTKISLEKLGKLETEVKWESRITLSFWQKVAVRLGNGEKYIDSETNLFITSLATLGSNLNEKMSEHNSEVMGITELPERSYIHSATASNRDNFIATARKRIQQLYNYTDHHGIPVKGSPEIIIHKRENNNRNFLFSVALPLIDGYELNIENPEIVIGVFESRSTLKTSLKGDYKYWGETLELGIEYLEEQRLDYPLEEGIVLKLINYKELPVNPAEWLTEIYIPAYEPMTLSIP